MDASWTRELAERVKREIARILVGMDEKVELLLVALLARGHVIVEGVPGVAKTSLAKAFAQSLGLEYGRIQFTPDTLPSDVTGSFVYDQRRGDFVFKPGPIFTNILLADEINRASPRTQSALLEAMQERQVTVWGETFKLPEPFMVIATLNPVESVGVFPLPEAQLDRFTLKIVIEKPTRRLILEVLERAPILADWRVGKAASREDILKAMGMVLDVRVSRTVNEYIAAIVEETHRHEMVALGASPRAALSLNLAARALALIRGRDYVIPEDVKYLAKQVLAHRIIVKPEARAAGVDGLKVVDDVLKRVDLVGIEKR